MPSSVSALDFHGHIGHLLLMLPNKNYLYDTRKMSLYWIRLLEMTYPFVFLTLLRIRKKGRLELGEELSVLTWVSLLYSEWLSWISY